MDQKEIENEEQGKKYIGYRCPPPLYQYLLSIKEPNQTISQTLTDIITQHMNTNKYELLDNACPALIFLDDGKFYCARLAPKITKLGSGNLNDAKKICQACEELKRSEEETQKIKKQLEQGIAVELPYCGEGGRVSEDLKKIYCPKIYDWRTTKQCKTLLNGANCKSFKYITVTRNIGGK